MIYNPYEILGLDSDFTREQLDEAYRTQRAHYRDLRFESGEVGADAAERLEQIESAYKDLLNTLERRDSGSYDSYAHIKQLIIAQDFNGAQAELDKIDNRDAEWHYVQSDIFFKKNWFVEAKKQLEIAINMDPNNSKYTDTLDKLNNYLASNTVNPDQMRTTSRPVDGTPYNNGTCTGSCCGDVCLANVCANCLCGGCH
ncbi:MAG: hypothetical protein PHW00_03515 [Clostridia bacterium]|nr:hypothetical protein [Clostridia bacterium]